MFNSQIIDSDAFLDMPLSAQALYFHLAMRADDDGFVGNPRKILRMTGGNEDDFKLLVMKRFLLSFESGVVVIKHWLIHNLIRADLYKETQYKKEKSTLGLNENGAYTELRPGVIKIEKIKSPDWLKKRRGKLRTANGTQSAPRIDKDSIGKVSIGKDRLLLSGEDKTEENEAPTPKTIAIEFFNQVESLKNGDQQNSERLVKHINTLTEKYSVPYEPLWEEIKKFTAYWTEPNKSGSKERWEMEKTFEISRRLTTWFGNVKKFNNLQQNKGREIIR